MFQAYPTAPQALPSPQLLTAPAMGAASLPPALTPLTAQHLTPHQVASPRVGRSTVPLEPVTWDHPSAAVVAPALCTFHCIASCLSILYASADSGSSKHATPLCTHAWVRWPSCYDTRWHDGGPGGALKCDPFSVRGPHPSCTNFASSDLSRPPYQDG